MRMMERQRQRNRDRDIRGHGGHRGTGEGATGALMQVPLDSSGVKNRGVT